MERIERIHSLYYGHDKSMKQIGRLFGISRERVRQLMDRAGYDRRHSGWHIDRSNWRKITFRTEVEYFNYVKKTGREHRPTMDKFFKNPASCCECCGANAATHKLSMHHIAYPATKRSELVITCYSCHKRLHGYGHTQEEVVSLGQDYLAGLPPTEIAEKYNVERSNIYYYLKKLGIDYRFGRYSLVWRQTHEIPLP